MRPQRRRPKPRPQDRPASSAPSGPIVEVTIDAVGGEGDGMGAGPVFVPFTLPGERVTAQGSGERRDLIEVLSASDQRIEPACPHFTHLRRLRAATLGARTVPRLEGRADGGHPGP